ncbi:MAG: GAF domain-containing protein [Thermoleophilia bacterium]|nr:GAF domain-containing protein [Thermoleophilia bacterium]
MAGADGSERMELARARETIAEQAAEIERLRATLAVAATAGVIGSPVTHARLLEMIVETGVHVIGARAGALFLLDEARSELVFEVAVGGRAEQAKRFRVPLGHGIAGIVAVSGQAMAISDAAGDPRLAADIAQGVGYLPETVLCVPLFYGNRTIGALELLDKHDGRTFDAADMQSLSLFANQAAVALELSRTYRAALRFGERADPPEDTAADDALELAELVHEIAQQGESERAACRTLLRGFADYLRAREAPASGLARLMG